MRESLLTKEKNWYSDTKRVDAAKTGQDRQKEKRKAKRSLAPKKGKPSPESY